MKILKRYLWLIQGSLMSSFLVGIIYNGTTQDFASGVIVGILSALFFTYPYIKDYINANNKNST